MTLPRPRRATTLTARAVLFDMDGTLVDSTSIVERVWTTFAGRYGLDIGEILRSSHGVQAMDTVRRFAPAGADVHALAAELGRMELAETRGIVPVPGAVELLAVLPPDAVAGDECFPGPGGGPDGCRGHRRAGGLGHVRGRGPGQAAP